MVVELFRVEVEMILTRLCLGGSTRDLARPAHGHCSADDDFMVLALNISSSSVINARSELAL